MIASLVEFVVRFSIVKSFTIESLKISYGGQITSTSGKLETAAHRMAFVLHGRDASVYLRHLLTVVLEYV